MTGWVGRLLPVVAVAGLLGCTDLPPSDPPAVPVLATAEALSPRPIDAALVKALYSVPHREDGTVMQGSHQGAQWTKWSKPDGSLELLAGHGLFADTGKYVIRGNMLCTTWGHIDGGQENCVHLVQVSGDEYMTYGVDGSQGSRFLVRPP